MALGEEGSAGIPATMLVGPASVGSTPYPVYMGGGSGSSGSGMGGWGDGAWIILLIIVILAAGGGWGNSGNGGGAFSGQPIVINDGGNYGSVQRGFDQAALMSGIGSVQSGVQNLATQLCGCCGDMQMSLCNGFANTTAAITGAQNALAQQLYSNELASLNRSFAEQTANTAGFNGVQSGLCDVRYGNAMNTQTILTALNDGVRSIKDQLCQDKLDAKDDLIAQLRQENLYARGQASQIAQNSTIINGIYDRLNQCPVGTVPVFGEQPIFSCPTNVGSNCGCGCNGNF